MMVRCGAWHRGGKCNLSDVHSSPPTPPKAFLEVRCAGAHRICGIPSLRAYAREEVPRPTEGPRLTPCLHEPNQRERERGRERDRKAKALSVRGRLVLLPGRLCSVFLAPWGLPLPAALRAAGPSSSHKPAAALQLMARMPQRPSGSS